MNRTHTPFACLPLILLLLGFGYTAATEVLFPASVDCQPTHDHTGSGATYCGCQVELPPHHCIHSTTTLDVAETSPPERRFVEIEVVYHYLYFSYDAPSFDHYNLRAPPSLLS